MRYGYEVISGVDLIFGCEVRGHDMVELLGSMVGGGGNLGDAGSQGVICFVGFHSAIQVSRGEFAHDGCKDLRWLIFVDCNDKLVYLDFQCGSGVAGDRLEFRTVVDYDIQFGFVFSLVHNDKYA